jgi:NADH:ubiquinone oxidoreductase subunit 2 (subunit N)
MSASTIKAPKYLINFSALSLRNYIFAISFSLLIFAIAGVPPLAGFFSKFFVLFVLIGANYYLTGFSVIVFSY